MPRKIILTIFLICLGYHYSFSQNIDTKSVGRQRAIKVLNEALIDTTSFNIISSQILLKDSITAISVAEPILFSVYGKKDILFERPYQTYLIGKYWVIWGVLPKGWIGGTFLIIIDATNSKIIKLIHGK